MMFSMNNPKFCLFICLFIYDITMHYHVYYPLAFQTVGVLSLPASVPLSVRLSVRKFYHVLTITRHRLELESALTFKVILAILIQNSCKFASNMYLEIPLTGIEHGGHRS